VKAKAFEESLRRLRLSPGTCGPQRRWVRKEARLRL